MYMIFGEVVKELRLHENPEKAKIFARFFKTGKGEYGEGDTFLGLTVPQQRRIAKKYWELPLRDIEKLLHNNIHEYRLTALFILSDQFKKVLRFRSGQPAEVKQKAIYDFYLANTKYINNWDLIDLSARDIVGGYLIHKPKERKILYKLARSKSLWERRISVLATFAFLPTHDFRDSFAIAKILLHDPHDLIHKAVGWMLREVGKRDLAKEEAFLKKHAKTMPRTMLRYAIERFSETKRRSYLQR